MKIKRTLCGVSLLALLAAGVAVFAGFPAQLDGQDANSRASPDVNDLVAKRAALVGDSSDFDKIVQSLGTNSPNFWLESQIGDNARTGTVAYGTDCMD